MSTFLGEIQLFGGPFAPSGFMFCQGQLLPIQQNEALYSLLGPLYGGDGRTTFGLPDLSSRVAIHEGQSTGLSNYPMGSKGGAAAVTLVAGNIPPHVHELQGSSSGDVIPNAGVMAAGLAYAPPGSEPPVQLAGATVESTPPQPALAHENRQPYLALSYIICVAGIYPSRS